MPRLPLALVTAASLLLPLSLALAPACTPHGDDPEFELEEPEEPDVELPDGCDYPDEVGPERDEDVDEPVKSVESVEPDHGGGDMTPIDPQQEQKDASKYCQVGRDMARRAIQQERLSIHTFGYPASCRARYGELLKRTYDVDLVAVAGCVVDRMIIDSTACYNEVMHAEIERRYGKGALDKIAKKAGCT